MSNLKIKAQFPEILSFLSEPYRYKILFGGRGSGKSWGVARELLIQGAMRQNPLPIVTGKLRLNL